MAWSTDGKNAMLTNMASQCGYMALYSDIAGTTEITGGSYARKAITWGAAANGSIAISNAPVFDVPAGQTVQAIGVCTALTGGTQYGFDDVTSEAYGGAGTYTVTAFTGSIT